MWSAGLENQDVKYATDPFHVFVDGSSEGYRFIYEASSAVLGLLRFVRRFEDMTVVELIGEYPQIAECSSVLGDNSIQEILDLSLIHI